ncbi:hypothetical protein GCM10017673_08590 [Streptosporangium violaceochromogenes]|nr:hypothetical protein GCM10017673_08590 [Streptosporangium violaceochromogenes]
MRRIAVGLLSAAVSGSLLLATGTASAERTALSVCIDSVNPNPVVVKDGQDTGVTVEVRTTEAARVELKFKPVSGRFRAQDVNTPKVMHEGDLWRFITSFDENDSEGRWVAIADAYDKDGRKVTDQVNFSVKQEQQEKTETRLTGFRAGPASVGKGRWVYFTGRLQADEDRGWRGVEDEEVAIYFRARGSSSWKWATSADTERRGRFEARARALRSGEYRAVYEGNRDLDESDSRSAWIRVWRR